MPSASLELRQEWEYEARSTGAMGPDDAARHYLQLQGYVETVNPPFFWHKPKPDHVPTKKEWSALYYLIYEWGHGGLVPADETQPTANPEGRIL